ncbi:Aste57867_15972 [Aphanomyces stellatus]|uniref:Aste57867_15972 protein n=1 Tax=Aphanomyces stellatus TaxID=120398 RepID=A0A485L689_9STRA|nr:hypothetical protein As57867_015916 [Aphanomyces stellatus]VFT92757.1 Aste57867_15972 [Aphanomyces stellatus]
MVQLNSCVDTVVKSSDTSLTAAAVRFPSVADDSFSLQLTSTDGNFPASLWLKSNTHMTEWECHLESMECSSYSTCTDGIQPQDLLSSIHAWLTASALSQSNTATQIDLKEGANGCMSILVAMRRPDSTTSLVSGFAIELLPLALDVASSMDATMAVLRRQMHVQDAPALTSLTSSPPFSMCYAMWTPALNTDSKYFALFENATAIRVLKAGTFRIQLTMHSASACHFDLYVNGTKTAALAKPTCVVPSILPRIWSPTVASATLAIDKHATLRLFGLQAQSVAKLTLFIEQV